MQNDRTDLNGLYQTLVVIWAALLFSQFLLLLLIFFVKHELFNFDPSKSLAGDAPIFVVVLAAISIFNFFAAFRMRRKFLRDSVEQQNVGLVQTALVISCALGESISLFGVLLAFVQNYQYFFLFFALGIFTIVLNFPRRDDVMAAGFKR